MSIIDDAEAYEWMKLTPEQQKAHDTVIDWFKNPLKTRKYITFGGLAGCGKTTTAAELARTLKKEDKKIAFCAISGKASSVLRSKLNGIIKPGEDYCGTIHGFIYKLIGKEKLRSGRTELYFEADLDKHLPFDVIFLDESSMCDEYTFRDLSSYNIPIVCFGDHKQLGPVKGKFNLMASPQIKLETIMRQAEGNPIIKLATMARNGDPIPYGNYGGGCIKTHDVSVFHKHDFNSLDSMVLCGKNATRCTYNSFARRNIGMDFPVAGEPVICLFNNRRKLIFNGNIGTLKSIDDFDEYYEVEIDFGDFVYNGEICSKQFGLKYNLDEEERGDFDVFDWSYVVTTWKAQGSEFKNVIWIDEPLHFLDDDAKMRLAYTSITRAKEQLIIFKR